MQFTFTIVTGFSHNIIFITLYHYNIIINNSYHLHTTPTRDYLSPIHEVRPSLASFPFLLCFNFPSNHFPSKENLTSIQLINSLYSALFFFLPKIIGLLKFQINSPTHCTRSQNDPFALLDFFFSLRVAVSLIHKSFFKYFNTII